MKKTVAELIEMGRDKAQRWDLSEIPDGYAAEAGQYAPGVTAIRIVQGLVREMTRTGINRCTFEFPMVANQRSYLISRRLGDIKRAYIVQNNALGREWPVFQTSENDLDESMPGWNTVKTSRVTHYYWIGTKAIGVYPLPLTAQYTIKFSSVVPITEPTAATDIIGGLLDDVGDPLIDGDGIQASIVPDEMIEHFTSGIAARIARLAKDWSAYGSYNKEWKEGLAMLKDFANNRVGVDRDDFIVDMKGRITQGMEPRW